VYRRRSLLSFPQRNFFHGLIRLSDGPADACFFLFDTILELSRRDFLCSHLFGFCKPSPPRLFRFALNALRGFLHSHSKGFFFSRDRQKDIRSSRVLGFFRFGIILRNLYSQSQYTIWRQLVCQSWRSQKLFFPMLSCFRLHLERYVPISVSLLASLFDWPLYNTPARRFAEP